MKYNDTTHCDSTFKQSNITIFHPSPLLILSNSIIASEKFEKLLYSPIASPYFTS